MRTLTTSLLALVLVAGLGACGSEGDDDASPTTERPSASTTSTELAGTEPDGGSEGTTTTPSTGGGGGSGAADEAAYEDALAANLSGGSSADGELDITDEQAGCVAPEWVSIVGVEAFTDADVTPAAVAEDTFTPSELLIDVEQGAAMVDALVDCDVEVFDQYFAVLSEGLSPEQVACLRTEFDDDLARRFLAEALTQQEPSADLEATLEGVDETCQLSES